MIQAVRTLVLSLLFTSISFAAQIVPEVPHVACEEFQLARELKIYKDPTLFLSNLNLIYTDPQAGWESLMVENPLLTSVKGTVRIMKLGNEREFKNFGAIAKIYELAEPKLKPKAKTVNGQEIEKSTMIIPIKVCGGQNDPYADTLGFVLVSDLKNAQIEEQVEGGSMPPSTSGHPIPKLRKAPYWE
jgi:hypothetical protein